MLYLYPPDGRSPSESQLSIRAKASTYAFVIGEGTRQLDLANLSFVATTIEARSYDPEIPAHGDASVNPPGFFAGCSARFEIMSLAGGSAVKQ